MNALPALIESRNAAVESELDIFFKSESNDNLMGSDSRHPIDVFQAAYLALKNTPSADVLVRIVNFAADDWLHSLISPRTYNSFARLMH